MQQIANWWKRQRMGIKIIVAILIAVLILSVLNYSGIVRIGGIYNSNPNGKGYNVFGVWGGGIDGGYPGSLDVIRPNYPSFVMSMLPSGKGENFAIAPMFKNDATIQENQKVVYVEITKVQYIVRVQALTSQTYIVNGQTYSGSVTIQYVMPDKIIAWNSNKYSLTGGEINPHWVLIKEYIRAKIGTEGYIGVTSNAVATLTTKDVVIYGILAGVFSVSVIVEGAVMKISGWGDWIPKFTLSNFSATLCSDECALLSGTGKITAPTTPVEEGKEATFLVDADYATSCDPNKVSDGWWVRVYKPSDQGGTMVFQTNVPDNVRARAVKWTVPTGSFVPTSTNKYRVVLNNGAVDQSVETVCIVDAGGLNKIPGKPTYRLISGEAKQGSSMTFELKACANSITLSPIVAFNVYAQYVSETGQTVSIIINNQDYSAVSSGNNEYYTLISIEFPFGGNLKIESVARDQAGRNSEKSIYLLTVQPQTGDGNASIISGIVTKDLVGLVVIIIGAIVGAIVSSIPAIPFRKQIGIFIILLSVGVGLGFILGYIGLPLPRS